MINQILFSNKSFLVWPTRSHKIIEQGGVLMTPRALLIVFVYKYKNITCTAAESNMFGRRMAAFFLLHTGKIQIWYVSLQNHFQVLENDIRNNNISND